MKMENSLPRIARQASATELYHVPGAYNFRRNIISARPISRDRGHIRVCLLSPRFGPEDAVKSYLEALQKLLPQYNIEVDSITSSNRPGGYFRSAVHDIAATPLSLLKKRGYDVYHALMPNSALFFPLMKKSNTVVTFHDVIPFFYNEYGYPFFGMTYIRAFLRAATRAKHIIAQSSQTKSDVIRLFKLPESKVTVIPYAISDRFKPIKRPPNETPVIGYLGGFGKRRRVDILLEAVEILNKKYKFKCNVDIWGKPKGEHKKLLEYAKGRGLDNVRFRGFAPEKRIVEIYNSFDVFVFPSDMEGFGCPILEASACGRPVIVRDGAYIPKETTEGCVKCRSADDIAANIRDLLTDKNLYNSASEKGITVAKRFTWERTAKETAGFYFKITS